MQNPQCILSQRQLRIQARPQNTNSGSSEDTDLPLVLQETVLLNSCSPAARAFQALSPCTCSLVSAFTSTRHGCCRTKVSVHHGNCCWLHQRHWSCQCSRTQGTWWHQCNVDTVSPMLRWAGLQTVGMQVPIHPLTEMGQMSS